MLSSQFAYLYAIRALNSICIGTVLSFIALSLHWQHLPLSTIFCTAPKSTNPGVFIGTITVSVEIKLICNQFFEVPWVSLTALSAVSEIISVLSAAVLFLACSSASTSKSIPDSLIHVWYTFMLLFMFGLLVYWKISPNSRSCGNTWGTTGFQNGLVNVDKNNIFMRRK